MNTMIRSTLGIAAALLLSIAVQAAELSAGAFSIGVAKGDVTYRLANSETYLPGPAGTALPQGALLKTGPGSSATIVFSNGSVATVGASSVVEVSRFQQEPFTGTLRKGSEPSLSDTHLVVIEGQLTSNVVKLRKGSKYTVSSPVGAAGVRGTIFVVNFNQATGQGAIEVVEGSIVLTFPGREVVVGAGFYYDSASSQVLPLSPARTQEIQNQAAGMGTGPGTVYDSNTATTGDTGPSIPLTDLIGVSVN